MDDSKITSQARDIWKWSLWYFELAHFDHKCFLENRTNPRYPIRHNLGGILPTTTTYHYSTFANRNIHKLARQTDNICLPDLELAILCAWESSSAVSVPSLYATALYLVFCACGDAHFTRFPSRLRPNSPAPTNASAQTWWRRSLRALRAHGTHQSVFSGNFIVLTHLLRQDHVLQQRASRRVTIFHNAKSVDCASKCLL
jgi:hypothetical protein